MPGIYLRELYSISKRANTVKSITGSLFSRRLFSRRSAVRTARTLFHFSFSRWMVFSISAVPLFFRARARDRSRLSRSVPSQSQTKGVIFNFIDATRRNRAKLTRASNCLCDVGNRVDSQELHSRSNGALTRAFPGLHARDKNGPDFRLFHFCLFFSPFFHFTFASNDAVHRSQRERVYTEDVPTNGGPESRSRQPFSRRFL